MAESLMEEYLRIAAFMKHFKKKQIEHSSRLPGSRFIVPYVLVADDAFGLSKYLMKPYSQTGLTTDRLTRAR